MTIGQKIKKIRLENKMTQSDLAGEKITRNMLSSIECDKALPSLDTLLHIAERLSVPASYFVSADDDRFFYLKQERTKHIRASYAEKKYSQTISLISELGGIDDELALILAECYFELGKKQVLTGALLSAKKNLALSAEYSAQTVYDTSRLKLLIPLYSALAGNIQSPLLEFDFKRFEGTLCDEFDIELYKYVMQDQEYRYKISTFAKHRAAKELMKNRQYSEAKKLLLEIIEERMPEAYNVYVVFGIYSDLETCSKQLMDFEGAYKYASKRLSMLEGFKT